MEYHCWLLWEGNGSRRAVVFELGATAGSPSSVSCGWPRLLVNLGERSESEVFRVGAVFWEGEAPAEPCLDTATENPSTWPFPGCHCWLAQQCVIHRVLCRARQPRPATRPLPDSRRAIPARPPRESPYPRGTARGRLPLAPACSPHQFRRPLSLKTKSPR